jgi:hypothetical protein
VIRPTATIFWVAAICAALAGCSRCSGEREAPGPGPDGGGALYDKLPLGAKEPQIRTALAALAGLSEKEAWLLVSCADQAWIDVLDLDNGALSERPSGGRAVRRCTLPDAGAHTSSMLRSARVDFLDGKAVGATWSFAAADFDAHRRELAARLGEGEEVRLEERSAVGELQRSAVVWRFGGEAWALVRGLETRAIRQSAEALRALPEGAAVPKRGDKVSLDDLGLGGGLDLNKPVPDVSDILPKDAGVR